MEFLSSLLLLVLGASAVVADPTALTKINAHDLQERGCLSDSQSRQIVDTFNYLLANPNASDFNATVDALLADDYSEWSDSINFIIHIPVSSKIRSSLTPPLPFGGGPTAQLFSSDCCSKYHLAGPTDLHIEGGIHFRIRLTAAADPEDAGHFPRLQPHQLALGLGPRGR
jgi:hypothetical protein